MKISKHLLWLAAFLAFTSLAFADGKPKLTLDEFFNSVSYNSVAISPDGNSVVIATERADWDQKIFRDDLWLYRDDARVDRPPHADSTHPIRSRLPTQVVARRPLDRLPLRTQDFLRKGFRLRLDDDKDSDKEVSQLYVISPAGGEAIPLTQGEEEVHTFSWSADSHTIYFATRNPWTKAQKDDYKKQWKDVVQYRTAERGDTIFALDLAYRSCAQRRRRHKRRIRHREGFRPHPRRKTDRDLAAARRGSGHLTRRQQTSLRHQLHQPAPGESRGRRNLRPGCSAGVLARVCRQRKQAGPSTTAPANPQPGLEGNLHWANDNRHIFFTSENDPTGPYRDLQLHLYWVDSEKST